MKAIKGPYDIAVMDEHGGYVHKTVRGFMFRWVGVHKTPDCAYRSWAITHLPTGFSFGDAGHFRTCKEALAIAERLNVVPGIENGSFANCVFSGDMQIALKNILAEDSESY
jgi:hypothetical protein